MASAPGSKNPLVKDTILFLIALPVTVIVIPVVAFVVPLVMGVLKLLGLVDWPQRPNSN